MGHTFEGKIYGNQQFSVETAIFFDFFRVGWGGVSQKAEFLREGGSFAGRLGV